MPNQQGLVFIIAAPSGAGKTTIVRKLLAQNPDIKLSISHTTRQPREGEKNGEDYHFTTVIDFETRIKQNEFLEYAKVYQNYYGTSLSWLKKALSEGHDVLLEIDVQGAAQVKEKLPEAITIFILPPDIQTLEERLTSRQTDSKESIDLRLAEAKNEIAEAVNYDYTIINDQLDVALYKLNSIVISEHLKTTRQLNFLQNLLAKA